jgi:hypothetical protein
MVKKGVDEKSFGTHMFGEEMTKEICNAWLELVLATTWIGKR